MEKERPLDGARFSQLVLSAHQRMKMLVLAIAPGCGEVDDVVQEACAAMWRKIDQYDPDRDFATWALTYVRFQTLAWLKRQSRDRVRLSEETIEQLCVSIGSDDRFGRERAEALELCMAGLSDEDQDLMAWRFVDGATVADIAKRKSDKSVDSLYKTFARLKASLIRCVESKLQEASA